MNARSALQAGALSRRGFASPGASQSPYPSRAARKDAPVAVASVTHRSFNNSSGSLLSSTSRLGIERIAPRRQSFTRRNSFRTATVREWLRSRMRSPFGHSLTVAVLFRHRDLHRDITPFDRSSRAATGPIRCYATRSGPCHTGRFFQSRVCGGFATRQNQCGSSLTTLPLITTPTQWVVYSNGSPS